MRSQWFPIRTPDTHSMAELEYDVFLSHNAQDNPRVPLLCISPAALASSWVALERSAAHRDPAPAGRRFIPLLLGDCDLPDTLRRYKYVDSREESEAALAEVQVVGEGEMRAMKRRMLTLPGQSRYELN